MERIYGRSHPGKTYGRTWVNARFFTGVEPGVSAVWLDGEEPAIRAAYEAAGVKVHAGLPKGPEKSAAKTKAKTETGAES